MTSHTRFPAPKSYESTDKAKAYRALRAAERLVRYLDQGKQYGQHTSRFEEIDWHENYWDDSCTSELGIYTGNWNRLDTYNAAQKCRETLPGGYWIEALGERLEKLGAEIVWSDQHSTCGDCGKLIRTDPDSMSWTPDFHVGEGDITCLGCLESGLGGESDVVEGCASILWASVWADVAEESDTYNLSGCEITEHMPAIPDEAYELARKVLADTLKLNARYDVAGLLRRCLRRDIAQCGEHIPHFSDYATRFGECLAYAAMGAGVSWEDDHAEPDIEYSRMFVCGGHVPALEGLAAAELGAVYSESEGKWVTESEETAEQA